MILGWLRGRADDVAEIYADGVSLMTITGPFSTAEVKIRDNTRLLAVRVENTNGNERGIIIKLSSGFVTNSTHWRCSSTHNTQWNKLSYDDDIWQPAKANVWPKDWAPHSLNPAEFIWARTNTDVVYCRGWPSKLYTS